MSTEEQNALNCDVVMMALGNNDLARGNVIKATPVRMSVDSCGRATTHWACVEERFDKEIEFVAQTWWQWSIGIHLHLVGDYQ